MADKPLWRLTLVVDRRIARPVEAAARSEAFGDVPALAVKTRNGEVRVLLARPVADRWATMATAGIDDALT